MAMSHDSKKVRHNTIIINVLLLSITFFSNRQAGFDVDVFCVHVLSEYIDQFFLTILP